VNSADAVNMIKATKARYVVLDGIRDQVSFSAELQIEALLVKERVPGRKVFFVRSMGYSESVEDSQLNKVDSFEVYPWRLSQYLAAYTDTKFQEIIQKYLDA
jgi:hypothetical protein